MRNLLKKLLLILFGLLVGLLLVLGGFEFYLRQTGNFELQRFYPDYTNDFKLAQDLYKCKRVRISPYPGLGWENDPSYPSHKYLRSTNPKMIAKDNGTYRILAIGDSVTYQGYYEKFLEEMLNNSNFGYKFEVWNCGTGGYRLSQYYHYLKHKGIEFTPDMVIIGLGIGDMAPGATPVVLETEQGYVAFKNPFTYFDIPLNKYLFLHSRVYRFILYKLEGIFKVKRLSDQMPYLSLCNLVNLVQSKDIKIAALIWPFLKNDYSDEELHEYNKIKVSLEKYNIPYIDLHASLPNRDLLNLRDRPQDCVHPSKEAFRIMTIDIYNFLIDNFDFTEGS